MNPLIFRAYDIRGVALPEFGKAVDLDNDAAYDIGRAFGTYITKKVRAEGRKDSPKIFCGRDNRLTSEDLQQAYISGLLTTGCDVTNIGLSTSPMLYFASCFYDIDAGTNVTASHNPKEYNGFKLVSKNANSVCGDEIQKLLKIIEEESLVEGKGEYKEQEIFPDYLKVIKEKISFPQGSLKVVIDSGNGVTGMFAPQLYEACGLTIVPLYCELDGNFPNHEANPEEEENVEDLKKKVVEEKANLGIAFDGDGDRVGIIDEHGKHYHADYLLIPLARDLLTRHRGAKIIFDVKASKAVEDDIRKHGGIPIRYKTGHSFIETKMKQEGSLLAGEMSGHLFFGENYYGFDDGLLAGLKLLEIMVKNKKQFSQLFQDIPQVLSTPEYKVPCDDRAKFLVVEDVKQYFLKRYPCLTIDGVWVDFGNGAWGACRASNTNPCLTLRFEARTPQQLALAKKTIIDKLKEYPEVQLPESLTVI